MAPPVADPKDPLPLVLIILSAVTGLVDAVSVLGMGQVFVANMTGNTVFLGFAVGGAPGFEVPRYVAALLAFLTGALAGGRIANAFAQSTRRRWLNRAAVSRGGRRRAAASARARRLSRPASRPRGAA